MMPILIRHSLRLLAGTVLLGPLHLRGAEVPANTWVTIDDDPVNGCGSGLLATPQGMLQFGRHDGKGATHAWTELLDLDARRWVELKPPAGRVAGSSRRGSKPLLWKVEDGRQVPIVSWPNHPFWAANQSCWLPEEQRAFYFWGGSTFTYDPATRSFADLGVAPLQAPPDVMLGSMAWNPLAKEVVLFGGGYLQLYQDEDRSYPGERRAETIPPAWQPQDWDRRGTWAWSPAQRRWRKLDTAAPEVSAVYAQLLAAGGEMRTLWGASRGHAFAYGDLVLGTAPPALAKRVEAFAASLAAIAGTCRAKGAAGGDGQRFAVAAKRLTDGAATRLAAAAAALRKADGWQAFRALDEAERELVAAQEAIAPAPRPRHYARLVTDPVNKVMVLFGGDGEDRWLADTWLLHLDTLRWEPLHLAVHPPSVGSTMVAMDYDAKRRLVVLAHPTAGLWTFDAAKREWKAWRMPDGFGRQGRIDAWTSLEYDAARDLHVLAASSTAYFYAPAPRLTQVLRFDPATAVPAEPSAAGPEEMWRPRGFGGGCEANPPGKVDLAWSRLPTTQAEFTARVAEQERTFAAVPDNTWTELKLPYAPFGRAYGTFCYDWDRDELLFWGGGHSAYQGNEWSHYSLKANLAMESWNPEFAPEPHGSPDGPQWTPSFNHQYGTGHSYSLYQYAGGLKQVIMNWRYADSPLYDPDRMRYAGVLPLRCEKIRPTTPDMVEMNGAPENYGYFQHSHGSACGGGIWRREAAGREMSIIPGSNPVPPVRFNKAAYDAKRKRILFYDQPDTKSPYGIFWVYEVDANRWSTLTPKVEPEGATPPRYVGEFRWSSALSAKHDVVLILDQSDPASIYVGPAATWIYDCAANTLRRLPAAPVPADAGVIYAPAHDLFVAVHGAGGCGPIRVFVLRYRPGAAGAPPAPR